MSWLRCLLPSTLARRHILILGLSFFAIQGVCLVWLLHYLMTVQVNINLSNKASQFSNTYAFLAALSPEQRTAQLKRLTNARMHFRLTGQKPAAEELDSESSALFRLHILYTLATIYKGISFAYDEVPWEGYVPPEERTFSWDSATFAEFCRSAPLLAEVRLRSAPVRILWGSFTPGQADRIDIAGSAALPFNDGIWLVADIHDNEHTAVDATVFALSFLAQFLVLMLVVVLEIRLLVRPLRKISNDAARIDLDSPKEFQVPEHSYEEIKSLASSIRELTLRLSEQIHQRSMTLTSLSHDLRSPVCRLRMQLEKLEQEGVSEVRALTPSLDELQDLMDSVLSFARSGHTSEERVRISLPSLLHSLAEDYQDSGHQVRVLSADACHMALYPRTMRRCLENLVQNALDYARNSEECFEHHECEVQLTGIYAPDNGRDEYIIWVRDFGPGMNPADLMRVFEPFVRLETSRNRKTGGTGLGLSIARNLARLNHAEISLSNASPGLLAEVRIRLTGQE